MANTYDVAKCFLFLDDAKEGDGITNMKLQKLIYYAQGYFGAIFDTPLFEDNIEAWIHGPVVPNSYHNYKSFGAGRISYENDFNRQSLTTDEYELIEEIYNVFGQFSAWKLRDMTHVETPWLNHEQKAEVIPFSEIKDYFKNELVE
jgi:uncharacterized phage-associated protein